MSSQTELQALLDRMHKQYGLGEEDKRPMTSAQMLARANRRKAMIDQLIQNNMKVNPDYEASTN